MNKEGFFKGRQDLCEGHQMKAQHFSSTQIWKNEQIWTNDECDAVDTQVDDDEDSSDNDILHLCFRQYDDTFDEWLIESVRDQGYYLS